MTDAPFTITRLDGSRIAVADITTVAEGELLLDELERSIIGIEDQLQRAVDPSPDWRHRAKTALKHRRRLKPHVQHRIARLREAGREASRVERASFNGARVERKRRAFILAARDLLPPELLAKVWARAALSDPEAFAEGVPGEVP